jgi:hypothetical protein
MQIPLTSILYGNKKINNLPEFLGKAIKILLEVQFEPTTTEDGEFSCILVLGNSTTPAAEPGACRSR